MGVLKGAGLIRFYLVDDHGTRIDGHADARLTVTSWPRDENTDDWKEQGAVVKDEGTVTGPLSEAGNLGGVRGLGYVDTVGGRSYDDRTQLWFDGDDGNTVYRFDIAYPVDGDPNDAYHATVFTQTDPFGQYFRSQFELAGTGIYYSAVLDVEIPIYQGYLGEPPADPAYPAPPPPSAPWSPGDPAPEPPLTCWPMQELNVPLQVGGRTVSIFANPKYFFRIKYNEPTNSYTLHGCGSNIYGQLGLPETTEGLADLAYIQIPSGQPYFVECGGASTFVVNRNGWLYATGRNKYGQLGLGDTVNRFGFERVGSFLVSKVSVGGYSDKPIITTQILENPDQEFYDEGNAYIITKTGLVYVCGHNDHGQLALGDKTDRHTFTLNPLAGVQGTIESINASGQWVWLTTKEGSNALGQTETWRWYAAGYNKTGAITGTAEDADYPSWQLFDELTQTYYPPVTVVNGDTGAISDGAGSVKRLSGGSTSTGSIRGSAASGSIASSGRNGSWISMHVKAPNQG